MQYATAKKYRTKVKVEFCEKSGKISAIKSAAAAAKFRTLLDINYTHRVVDEENRYFQHSARQRNGYIPNLHTLLILSLRESLCFDSRTGSEEEEGKTFFVEAATRAFHLSSPLASN